MDARQREAIAEAGLTRRRDGERGGFDRERRETRRRVVRRREGKEGGSLSGPRPWERQPPKAPIWEAAAFFSTVASAEAS
jgi:hypothetical protein